ncbi:hypothetical protein LTLLF_128035 [Microtus ochrogaster]|uniref:Uncharacterized protein n=1 Tax=Microtus ochrogaster TaxID=79684 RepID=A0A8J6GLE9_MICOH|nr:hypothetical protein LTLLF_128035 [Microtus ochrogaster]
MIRKNKYRPICYGGHLQGQCHPMKPKACGGEEEMDPSHQELLSPTPQKQ